MIKTKIRSKYTLCYGVIVLQSITLQSCVTTVKIPQDERIVLDKKNITLINGRYGNSLQTNGCQGTTIWKHLKPFYKGLNKSNTYEAGNSEIGIKILNMNRIQFDYYLRDSVRETKVFTYRNKNGVLVINAINNWSMQGIPLLFFRQHKEKLTLALDKDLNLIMAYHYVVSGGPLIIIFGSSEIGTLKSIRTEIQK